MNFDDIGPGKRQDVSMTKTRLLEYIKKNCSVAVQAIQSQKTMILRGSSYDRHREIFIGNTRNNRPPKDSLNVGQEKFDNLITMAGGIAKRSNSIFVTGSEDLAENFGKIFYVFPFDGKFHYTWIYNQPDLVVMTPYDLYLNSKYPKPLPMPGNTKYNTLSHVEDQLPEGLKTTFRQWITSLATLGDEFNIRKFTSLKELQDVWERVVPLSKVAQHVDEKYKYLEALRFTPDQAFAKKWAKDNQVYFDTGLDKSLRTMNEIWITGYYLAVEAKSELGDYLANALTSSGKAARSRGKR